MHPTCVLAPTSAPTAPPAGLVGLAAGVARSAVRRPVADTPRGAA